MKVSATEPSTISFEMGDFMRYRILNPVCKILPKEKQVQINPILL